MELLTKIYHVLDIANKCKKAEVVITSYIDYYAVRLEIGSGSTNKISRPCITGNLGSLLNYEPTSFLWKYESPWTTFPMSPLVSYLA